MHLDLDLHLDKGSGNSTENVCVVRCRARTCESHKTRGRVGEVAVQLPSCVCVCV